MGVSHSMQKDQVEEVLTEFENTTGAIKGIESKFARIEGYARTVEDRRAHLAGQTEKATALIDNMTTSMYSDDFLSDFTEKLESFATMIELLEDTVEGLQLMNAPKELQKELGPLLVPSIVLVFIITFSNIYFGFLVANDLTLTEELSMESVFGEKTSEEGFNVLYLFAVFHTVLISLAVIYVFFEFCRKLYLDRENRESHEAQEDIRDDPSDEDSIADETQPRQCVGDNGEAFDRINDGQTDEFRPPAVLPKIESLPSDSQVLNSNSPFSSFSPEIMANPDMDAPPNTPKSPNPKRKDTKDSSPESDGEIEVSRKASLKSNQDSPSTSKSKSNSPPLARSNTAKINISGALRSLNEKATNYRDKTRLNNTPDSDKSNTTANRLFNLNRNGESSTNRTLGSVTTSEI